MLALKPLKLEDLTTVSGGMSRRALMLEMASMNMNSTLMQLQANPGQSTNNMMMAMYVASMMA